MFDFTGDRDTNMQKAIEACRTLMKTLANPDVQPLEREAGYLLAQALHMQVENLGLIDNPEIQDFLNLAKGRRPASNVRRFPDDFPAEK
ncbi:MAG TPA: hypothetical protein VJZ27_16425 [Aggregatilineales bacterium]|nr:hypothetical protein [Aggregatilineales bacterium]